MLVFRGVDGDYDDHVVISTNPDTQCMVKVYLHSVIFIVDVGEYTIDLSVLGKGTHLQHVKIFEKIRSHSVVWSIFERPTKPIWSFSEGRKL